VDINRAETPRPPDHDAAILLVPLEHGARSDAELLAHLGRDRDLALVEIPTWKLPFIAGRRVTPTQGTPFSDSGILPAGERAQPMKCRQSVDRFTRQGAVNVE